MTKCNFILKIFIVTILSFLNTCCVFAQGVEFVPGEILIKFKPNIVNLPSGQYKSSIANVRISTSAIDKLNKEFGVHTIERVFKEETGENLTRRSPLTGKMVTLIDLSQNAICGIFISTNSYLSLSDSESGCNMTTCAIKG